MAARLITGPRIIGGLLLLALAIAVYFAVRQAPVPVEVGEVSRGPLLISVEDEGETRVANLYIVSAPMTGQLLRVPLKPGDPVIAGRTVLARIQPIQPEPLSSRRYAETLATIRALTSQQAAIGARADEARARRDLAERELERAETLFRRGFVSKAALERARAERDRALASFSEVREAAETARFDREAAEAQLITRGQGLGSTDVVAPVNGRIMTVPQESERVVIAGTPLVEIGDPARLEIVTDLLSADAVRIRPGAPVEIDAWGGDRLLRGQVRLIEPYGFRKISALGVEEQRVNVIIALSEPRDAWERLGHGYRVIVRIAVSSKPAVLRVPVSALFRHGEGWSCFAIDADGRAQLMPLTVVAMNDEMAEVRNIDPGLRVILHPSDRVRDGVRVKEQSY